MLKLWRKPDKNHEFFDAGEQYRSLRGIVRHITNTDKPAKGRSAVKAMGSSYGQKRPWGTCKWCGMETAPRRMWHDKCAEQYFAAQGNPNGGGAIRGNLVELPDGNRRQACAACGKAGYASMELDHIMAIGIARRLGLYFYRRAFLPENLWWICGPCHKVKTAFDRAFMRSLDKPITLIEEREPLGEPLHGKSMPLFDWSA